ncbi:cytochrome P450 93A3 [Senna tora]|uniref:Cytochrome P450 93A3 n=1 Tax=Senna tora TaxID=362788 RepID=A0A835CLX8_9FABA|nr:cytochrome P450 93A3 [Senna tora]
MLREELDLVVGTKRLLKESDVGELVYYFQAVVKEVLRRLHLTVPITIRQPNADCNVNGYHIKGGTRTMINIYAIMRVPKAWEKPEVLIPKRRARLNEEIGLKQKKDSD